MDKIKELISGSGKLTVFFEEPFWVGVFECVSDGKLSVCKVTFGAETDSKHRNRNKIATGFETAAGAVKKGTQDCEPRAEGSRETTPV